MSNQKVATDFDQIIQADRQRRKNEELAKSIFSKKKPKDGGNRRDNQRGANSPSLASRIGVTKRSSSTSSIPSPRLPPTRPSSNIAQNARVNRIAAEINNNQNANIKPSPKTSGPGFSIKGSAAPFVVEARNFAPGTTDADIESAIQADCIDNSGINTLVSCRITSTKPTVVAEMVFTERSIAERIIERYHKQKADGRVLELRLARSGPGSMSKSQLQSGSSRDNSAPASIPTAPAAVVEPEAAKEPSEIEMEDIETEELPPQSSDAYDDERQAAERDRRDRESRRTDRDGYESNSNTNASSRRRDDERRDERYRDRDSDRERDRDRDRERERDRTQDRDYERRGDDNINNNSSNRSFNNRPDEQRGGGRPSHYGNGVGGSRPGYGGGFGGAQGSYRGGRTYSDDTRGGFGGRGGGYRGAWRPYR